MAVRLTRIYTRTGDAGSTRLGDGSERTKYDTRIQLLGELDELNACLGLILAELADCEVRKILTSVTNQLFDVGADACRPGLDGKRIADTYVTWLEQRLDELNESLPPLESFVLPGGNRSGAACHLARSVCRRAERAAVCCAGEEQLNPELLRYLNRLADLLFVCARTINGVEHEVTWEPGAALS